MLLSLITITAILQLAIATNVSPPILYSRHGSRSQHGSLSPSLEKRADCGDGKLCLFGSCCGDGCSMNCCALDNGGLGCGITERCQFKGNVFVGCCGNILGGCTGEATRVTVHTPYSTVTLGATTTEDVVTEVSTTATDTSTTTTEQTVTPTATATATRSRTTSSESESSSHSHRASASSSTSATTTSNSDHPRLTGGILQSSPSPSPNNNGGFSLGVGVPVLAGMVALGAVLL